MLYRPILIIAILCNSLLCAGQWPAPTDTLTIAEREQFRKATENSAYGCLQKARQFSAKMDSVNAGIQLMKTDPHYLMFLGQTPDSIHNYLQRNFHLTIADEAAYETRFRSAYAARSEVYKKMSAMYEEQQRLTLLADRCADSFTCVRAQKRMFTADSEHAAYLYNYVQKKGWPVLADGSLYAARIALHDYEHNKDYVPVLKQAVLRGDVTLEVLERIMEWGREDKQYTNLLDTLKTHEFRKFDISSVLYNALPPSLQKIEDACRKFCKVRFYYLYYGSDAKFLGDHWHTKRSSWEKTLTELTTDLSAYVCKETRNYMSIKYGLWGIQFLPPEGSKSQMLMYVVKEK